MTTSTTDRPPAAPLGPSGHSRRTVLRGLAASGLAVTIAPTLAARATAEGTRPPNVVVVSIDDLGWDELGCYGNTFNETPHIDRLARRGTRFTQAYAAAPLCSPTRAALMTGLYPGRTGITDFLRGEPAPSNLFLSPDLPTVPDVLGPHGYTTGLVGKWHLTETYSGPYASRPGNPYSHGFDEVVASEELYIGDGDYFHPYSFMPSLPAREPSEHLTDRLTQEAVDFIGRHAAAPFFLHVSNYAVHTRLDGKPDLVAKYQAKAGATTPGHRPVLAAMLESVDDQVGRILATLEELGLAEDTLLLVTSDNGGPYRDANAPLRGVKGELYEGGIRVPLVAHWPGTVPAGRTCRSVTSTVDVLPTALELAGGTPGSSFDGTSLVPALTGGDLDRETLFWVYPHFISQVRPHVAVRHGQYKLVRRLRDGASELYHVVRDPGEATDLAARNPAKVRELGAMLDAHLADLDLLPPPPSAEAYPTPELDEPFDGDLSDWDVLTVPGSTTSGTVAVAEGRVSVTSGPLAHALLRSRVSPGSDELAVVLDPGAFEVSGTQDTVFVGLARDAGNYLLFRYRHGLRRVGWDLRVGGTLVTAGGEPLDTLDGSVDLTGDAARYAFVLRGTTATSYVDQGNGWEFLYRMDLGGVADLRDPSVRAQWRYAASARVQDGTVSLDGITARRR